MLRPILKSYLTVLTIALTFVFMLLIKLPLALTLFVLLAINLLVLGVKKS
jgi:chromate transporter